MASTGGRGLLAPGGVLAHLRLPVPRTEEAHGQLDRRECLDKKHAHLHAVLAAQLLFLVSAY